MPDYSRAVRYFFFGAFLLLLYQFLKILSPFFIVLLSSTILTLMAYPLHKRVLARMPHHPTAAAVTTTTSAVMIVVLPVILFGWLFLQDAERIRPAVQVWIEQARLLDQHPLVVKISGPSQRVLKHAQWLLQTWDINPQATLLKYLDEFGSTMTLMAARFITNVLFVGLNIALITFAVFFFLRDGPTMIQQILDLIPMAENNKQMILRRIENTLLAVIHGVIGVALAQGFLAGLGYFIFQVPFPVPLGVITTFMSPIPIVGSALIWAPVVISLALSGSLDRAVYVTLWNVLLVGTLDNFLRPILIGSKAKLPFLLLFFGIVGGLRIYGFTGLLLGPLVIALALAFINIYRQEYRLIQTR